MSAAAPAPAALHATPVSDRDNIALIQVFRGIAASAVALHHIANRIHLLPAVADGTIPFWVQRILNTDVGAVGVDLFFVISGFIMTYTTPRERHPTGGGFLRRRILRIYPLYWLCSIAALVILATPWVQGLKYGPREIAQSLALYPTLYRDSIRPVLLPQGWTLVYEMLFYVVFALTIRFSRPRQLGAVVALFAGLFFAAAWLPVGHELRVLLRDQVLVEFILGMVLGVLFCEYKLALPPWAAIAAAAAGLLLLAPSAMVGVPDWTESRLLRFGLPAFLLIGGLLLHPRRPAWRLPRPLLLLGDASYSIYLTHTLVLAFFSIAYPRLALVRRLPLDMHFLLLAVAIAGVGCATYFAVEKPLVRLCRGRSTPVPAVPPVVAATP